MSKELSIPAEAQEMRDRLMNFVKFINKKPPHQRVKKNKFANNADYLPIGFYEREMDKVFCGQWKSRFVGGTKFAGAHSIVVDMEVDFKHPVTGEWLTRCGTGASQMQMDAKTGNVRDKAVEIAAPRAKTMAFKNACKSIGDLFGRHLNREDEGEMENYYKPLNK